MAAAEPLPGVDQYVDRLETAQRAGLAVYLHTVADRIRATNIVCSLLRCSGRCVPLQTFGVASIRAGG